VIFQFFTWAADSCAVHEGCAAPGFARALLPASRESSRRPSRLQPAQLQTPVVAALVLKALFQGKILKREPKCCSERTIMQRVVTKCCSALLLQPAATASRTRCRHCLWRCCSLASFKSGSRFDVGNQLHSMRSGLIFKACNSLALHHAPFTLRHSSLLRRPSGNFFVHRFTTFSAPSPLQLQVKRVTRHLSCTRTRRISL
jgi:hypothetical protein